MLDLNPETVCFLIDKAHEFQAKEGVVIPNGAGGIADDWAQQVLADHVEDLTFLEVKSTVDDLDRDQQRALVALMWLGRGDYEVGEWDAALAEAQRSWTQRTAEYLMSTPGVADYLEEGLAILGYSCED